tara:strand:- start:38 stop:574 length:537 start_codon:yes stop_codon:yes gene_type:complete
MIKFFLQKFESGIKDLSGGNSFSQKSIEKADDYLWDVYNEQKEIHRNNGLDIPDYTLIFDDEIINGYHYFHFKKFYDGDPEEFLEFYILKIFFKTFYVGSHNRYVDGMDKKYKFYKRCFLSRSDKFEKGIKLAEKDHKKILQIKRKKFDNKFDRTFAEIDFKYKEFRKIYANIKGLKL